MLFLVFPKVQSLDLYFSSSTLMMLHLKSHHLVSFYFLLMILPYTAPSGHLPTTLVVLQADITAISLHIESNRHVPKAPRRQVLSYVSILQTNQLHHSTFTVHYYRENSPLQQVDSVKYLGGVLTSDLTWSEHISKICSKVRKLIGLLYIVRFHHCMVLKWWSGYTKLSFAHISNMPLRYGIPTLLRILKFWKSAKNLPYESEQEADLLLTWTC